MPSFAVNSLAVCAFALLAAPAALAQSCSSLLIDDFKTVRPFTAPDGEFKRLNALGGDWGQYGGNFSIDTTTGSMSIVPQQGATVYTPDATFNPNTVDTYNWFYTQFNDQRQNFNLACFDARNYTALTLDVTAAAGTDFNITVTQRLAGNCSVRTFDSVYHPLSKYYTTPGVKQSIVVPFSDFAKDLSGADFNFQWVKDITWINLNPAASNITISNVYLLGTGCNLTAGNGSAIVNGSNTTNVANATSGNTSASKEKNSATSAQFNTAGSLAVAAVAGLAAFL